MRSAARRQRHDQRPAKRLARQTNKRPGQRVSDAAGAARRQRRDRRDQHGNEATGAASMITNATGASTKATSTTGADIKATSERRGQRANGATAERVARPARIWCGRRAREQMV